MTEPVPAAAGPRVIDYVRALLAGEAALISVGARVTAIRNALYDKAIDYEATEGVAPTMRAKGLGLVVLTNPDPKVGVRDRAAFGSYVAQAFPSEATAVVRFPVAYLEAALAALSEVEGFLPPPVTIDVNPAWEKVFLSKCAVVDHVVIADDGTETPARMVLAPDTGDILDEAGVVEIPAATRSLSVRLDPEAKARAIASVQDSLADGIEAALAVSTETTIELVALEGSPLCPDCGQRLDAHPAEYHLDVVSRETEEAEGGPDEPDDPGLPPVSREAMLAAMPVAQLRDEARFMGLPVSGSKAQLVERIVAGLEVSS